MITSEEIVTITLEKQHTVMCLFHAEKCTLGHGSQIFGRGAELEKRNAEDQITGQFGTCAFGIWCFRNGQDLYNKTRIEANKTPHKGDGGSDFLGYQIDVKTSRRRERSRDLLKYNFLIRPRDEHENTVYVQCITDYDHAYSVVENHFLGWCTTEDLPKQRAKTGIFKGAKVIPVTELRPMFNFVTEDWILGG